MANRPIMVRPFPQNSDRAGDDEWHARMEHLGSKFALDNGRTLFNGAPYDDRLSQRLSLPRDIADIIHVNPSHDLLRIILLLRDKVIIKPHAPKPTKP